MNYLRELFSRILQQNKHKKEWRIVTTLLASIVVFVTTYSLILPAITMDIELVSDMPGVYMQDTASTTTEEDLLSDGGASDFYGDLASDSSELPMAGDPAAEDARGFYSGALEAEENGNHIVAHVTEEAKLPADVTLQAKLFTPEEETYAETLTRAKDTAGSREGDWSACDARIFTVSFIDSEGGKITPAAPVEMEIFLAEPAAAQEAAAILLPLKDEAEEPELTAEGEAIAEDTIIEDVEWNRAENGALAGLKFKEVYAEKVALLWKAPAAEVQEEETAPEETTTEETVPEETATEETAPEETVPEENETEEAASEETAAEGTTEEEAAEEETAPEETTEEEATEEETRTEDTITEETEEEESSQDAQELQEEQNDSDENTIEDTEDAEDAEKSEEDADAEGSEDDTDAEDAEESEDDADAEDAEESKDDADAEDAEGSEDDADAEDAEESEDDTDAEDAEGSEDDADAEDAEESEDDADSEDAEESDDVADAEDGEESVSMPAVSFEAISDNGVLVQVAAPEGAFPKDTTMSIADVDDNDTLAAIEGTVEEQKTVVNVLAVDITFKNAEGVEIEPAVPVQVLISASKPEEHPDALASAVHVTDEGEATPVAPEDMLDPESVQPMETAEPQEPVANEESSVSNEPLTTDEPLATDESLTTEDSEESITADESLMVDEPIATPEPVAPAEPNAAQEETPSFTNEINPEEAVAFQASAFSVYAIVYTVDFRWEVDGKTYEFSMVGGDSIGFRNLVEMLHILDENEKGLSEEENEQPEDTKTDFINGIEKIEFSDESLVKVAQIAEDTTAGTLKESLGLECEYSAELTENQIKEMNNKFYYAPDWVLISLKAFDTDEYITVTMKTGETFTIDVKDAQLRTYVISDSGDMYEVIVTYDDTAEIPEDAELVVQEIEKDSDRFTENVELTDDELLFNNEAAVSNPVQFDISIVSNGVKVEPKEGSLVNVEIRLAKAMFGSDDVSEDVLSDSEDTGSDDSTGAIVFYGETFIDEKEQDEIIDYRVAHICDEGHVELIEDVEKSVNDDQLILQFDTGSFSDYLVDGVYDAQTGVGTRLVDLPGTMYVGDEIYMYNMADLWVTGIRNVNGVDVGIVKETKHDNEEGNKDASNFKTVTAINTGTFYIMASSDWLHYNSTNQLPSDTTKYKKIDVLAARTGTNPPRVLTQDDGIVSNSSIGLTLNLFDYDTDHNLDDYFNGGAHFDKYLKEQYFANDGINKNHRLKFWGSGIGKQYDKENEYNTYGVTQIVDNDLDGGYPRVPIQESWGTRYESLAYLFNPNVDTADREVKLGADGSYNVDGLFKKVGDYYIYDSTQNYAYYNPTKQKFDVYAETYQQKSRNAGGEQATQTNGKSIGFFPFHPWDNEYDLYVNWNKKLNHHFGLAMTVDFALPGGDKAVKDTDGNDIIFEFSGDDDMWVFIDGHLVMDIGGVHQPLKGTINFTTKQVNVQSDSNGSTTIQNYFDFNSSNIHLYDGEKHTLKVFYMERGGCDSNCMIKFNITRYGDVEFDKADADVNSKNLAGAIFALYKDKECTTPLMELLNNNSSRAFVTMSDEGGHVKFEGIPLGTYYMKEIGAPAGYPVEDTVWTITVEPNPNGNIIKAVTRINGEKIVTGTYGEEYKVLNEKPAPINLELEKIWQDSNGNTVDVPTDASATFELKRIRTYESITTSTPVNSNNVPKTSKLKVGWIHNDTSHNHREYDLIAGTNATISWEYKSEYTGAKSCVINGTTYSNSPAHIKMPGENGGVTTLYIRDNSESGDAITNITVNGEEFIGNSGGGTKLVFTRVSEPDPGFSYDGDSENVHKNQVTLPINNQWQYVFKNLPLFGVSNDLTKVYNYSYYLGEVNCTNPSDVTVIYKDSQGYVISKASDAETIVSGTQTITNQVNVGSLLITKNVLYNGRQARTDAEKTVVNGKYKFTVKNGDSVITGSPFTIEVKNGVSESLLIPNLEPGDYTIEEIQNNDDDFTLIGATGGNSVSDNKIVTVTVTAGKLTQSSLLSDAQAVFTNNYTEYEVVIIKTDMSNDSIKLGGAVFALYAEDAINEEGKVKEGAVPIQGKDKLTSSSQQGADLGKVLLGILKKGTYYLAEKEAPAGYLRLEKLVMITVEDGKVSLQQGTSEPQTVILQGSQSQNTTPQDAPLEIAEFYVRNNPGYTLPSTGGPGTKWYTLGGCLLMVLSAMAYIYKRRRRFLTVSPVEGVRKWPREFPWRGGGPQT